MLSGLKLRISPFSCADLHSFKTLFKLVLCASCCARFLRSTPVSEKHWLKPNLPVASGLSCKSQIHLNPILLHKLCVTVKLMYFNYNEAIRILQDCGVLILWLCLPLGSIYFAEYIHASVKVLSLWSVWSPSGFSNRTE